MRLYLKRLEAQGFKSFGERVCLELGHGITAVVGPNGSGKSNLSEAIRWVLGEQRPGQLRSSRMADVLYTGVGARRQAGMAEVALTFDNRDGSLPVDFAEVTVTRRLFRAGDSEYLLNRVPCRLRDVVALFLDTGLRDGLAIIGQGQVEEVLNARPEERRHLLEDAAGILRFKQRQEEARGRLAECDHSARRVADLLAELELQLVPLAREAQRAREQQALREELDRREKALLGWEAASAENRLAQAAAQARRLAEGLEELQARAAQSRVRQHEAEEQLALAQRQLEELRQAREALRARMDTERVRAQTAAEGAAGWRREAAQARRRLAEAERSAGELTAAFEELRARLTAVEERGSSLEEQIAARERELASAAGKLAGREEELEELKTRIIEAEREAARTRNRGGERERDRSRAVQELTRVREQARGAQARAEESRRELERVRREQARLEEEAAAAEALGRDLAQERRQAEAELGQAARELEAAQSKLRGADSRREALVELTQRLAGYGQGVQAVLRAAQQGKLTGILGVVAQLLQVPAAYRLAVEVALSPAVQHIVVERIADAEAAVGFLKRADAGRATFLPLDRLRPAPPAPGIAPGEGCLGVAADLVGCPQRFEPVCRQLLGRVAVFEDLAAALAWSRADRLSVRAVTLGGELLHPSGSLTGGSWKGRGTGLLGREEEIAVLARQAKEWEREVARWRQARDTLGAAIDRLKGEEAAAQRHGAERRANAAATGREAASAEAAVREQTALGGDLAAQEDLWAREAEQAAREAAELAAQAVREEAAARAAEEAREQLRRDLNAERSGREEQLEEIAALRMQLAAVRQEALDLGGQVERMERRRREQAHETTAATDQVGRLEVAAREDEERSRRAEAAVAECAAELAATEGEEAARDEACRHWVAQLAQLRRREARREASLEEAREALRTAELARAEVAAAARAARERLQEAGAGETYPEDLDPAAYRERCRELTAALEELGPVNFGVVEECQRVQERHDLLRRELSDIEQSRRALAGVVEEVEANMRSRLEEVLRIVRSHFRDTFRELFGGGNADLRLERGDVLEAGMEILVQPAGKPPQALSLLSGGERALAALALLFALVRTRSSPFYLLDEVEAALDEANGERFARYLEQHGAERQFLVITHQRRTMEAAHRLWGVSMDRTGTSRLVSIRLEEVS